MPRDWIVVPGILRKGHGVASGPSQDYPYGALARQVPIFAARGLDLRSFHLGTLNIDINPKRFKIVAAEHSFRDVLWTDLHPPEHFSFVRCQVGFKDDRYAGWIYYPHPETKLRHFHDPSLVEVITFRIPEVHPGASLELYLDRDRVAVDDGTTAQQPHDTESRSP